VLAAPDPGGRTDAGDLPSTAGVLRVTRARLAAPFGARSFQYQVSPDRVEAAHYDTWADDPGALITAATIEALASSGRFRAVVDDASLIATAGTLELYVKTLQADVRTDVQGTPRAVMAMQATLVAADGTVVHTGAYEATVPIESAGPEDLVGGWNAGLARILADVAADLARQ
jgi:ABC-type uncharacterized transport system auxiliary subunit